MYYTVEGFNFYREFNSEDEAWACFMENHRKMHYCEIKEVENTPFFHYAKSLKIYWQ